MSKGYEVHGIKRRSRLFNTDRVDHLYQDPHVDNQRFKLHYADLTDCKLVAEMVEADYTAARHDSLVKAAGSAPTITMSDSAHAMKNPCSLRIALLLALLPLSAHAYVDPGAGMLLVQGLVALVGAIIVFVKNPLVAIKALISRLRKKK